MGGGCRAGRRVGPRWDRPHRGSARGDQTPLRIGRRQVHLGAGLHRCLGRPVSVELAWVDTRSHTGDRPSHSLADRHPRRVPAGSHRGFHGGFLVLDRQPPLRVASPTTALAIIIAARNEERGIGETIAAISRTDYAGPVSLILADNGSTDRTCDEARRAAAYQGVSLRIISELTPGKSNALNTALQHVETPYVVTVDGDTRCTRSRCADWSRAWNPRPRTPLRSPDPFWCATPGSTCSPGSLSLIHI